MKIEPAHEEPQAAEDTAREQVGVTTAQVAAAQLQISIDRKLGRKTSKLIRMIAAAK